MEHRESLSDPPPKEARKKDYRDLENKELAERNCASAYDG
jgi:hypothetical protein